MITIVSGIGNPTIKANRSCSPMPDASISGRTEAVTYLTMVGPRKVRVSKDGVAAFNRQWPCSELRTSRAYWFEFENNGDLVDTDVPEQDDGTAAAAMADDAREFMFNDTLPGWAA